MSTTTLKHHRKTDNMYRFNFAGQTITVTRRFLPSRAVRVRVTSSTWSGKGDGNWTDYRDYTDMHEGDTAYSKQAQAFCAKWEARYLNSPAKEAPAVTDTTTPEPQPESQPTATQWAAGATMTKAKALELAERRTGVRHVLGDDGRTLCAQPAPTDTEPPSTVIALIPADAEATLNRRGRAALVDHHLEQAPGGPVLEGKVVGKLLGEAVYTVRSSGRPSRSGQMGVLLQITDTLVTGAQRAAHAHRTQALTGDEATDRQALEKVTTLQSYATYFRALRDAGYAPDTTWDELVAMVRPIVEQARAALTDRRAARGVVGPEGRGAVARSVEAAELFLRATAGIRYFYEDDSDA